MIEFSKTIVDSLDLDSGPIGIEDTMNAYWREQFDFIRELQNNVYKWAKQVRLYKAKPLVRELLDNNTDLF